MKLKHKLQNVPETMLISLRARYLESKENNGIINDPKSVEILDQIDCDFSGNKEVSKGSQKGTAVRTEIIDELTLSFIKKYPKGVVVNLGCGLDTRYYRLGKTSLKWFDLDVEESIALRKYFFKETADFKFIAKSVLDFSWVNEIPKNKPTLFIAEGLLMYFTENDVKSILQTIFKNFNKAEIILEAMSPFIAKNSDKHADVKKYNASFKWGINSGKEIEKWNIGFTFVKEYFYNRHLDKMPFFWKIFYRTPVLKKSMKIIHLITKNKLKDENNL